MCDWANLRLFNVIFALIFDSKTFLSENRRYTNCDENKRRTLVARFRRGNDNELSAVRRGGGGNGDDINNGDDESQVEYRTQEVRGSMRNFSGARGAPTLSGY